MLAEHERPRAHLVMDDFFAPSALPAVFAEVRSLARRMKPGLVRDIGHDGQSVFFAHRRRQNKAVWIHDPSRTLRLFREHLWSEPLVTAFGQAREPLFQIIPNCGAPHLQVSAYMTGDHYDFHEDEGAGVNLTAIVFLAEEPKKVHGGDLVLAYDGEEVPIRFRSNRLVVFPSKTLHRVTRVRVDSDDPNHARISLQCWLTYGRSKVKAKPRAPQVDRPSFLLAEEAILAAAQAMSTASGRDQSPESVYWGGFYLSRVLTQNLRCLIAEQPALTTVTGSVRIRRREDIEVHTRGKVAGTPVRVGFRLRGPGTSPSEALSLFVDRGTTKKEIVRLVPPGAGEVETAAILRQLLKRV